MTVLQFPRVPLRAFVVIPGDWREQDVCRVRVGGWAIDFDPPVEQGSLPSVLARLRSGGQGVPITVHPECKRRAAA